MSESSDRLMYLIQSRGISYGELSDQTGIPKSALHRYANGNTDKIPADRAELIGKALGTTGAWILGLTEETTRLLGYHTVQIYGGMVRIIDELDPEVYVDIPGDEYERMCAADDFNNVLARLRARADELKEEKLAPELRDELDEVTALFRSLTADQKEQARNFLRFLKGTEGKK